MIQKELGKNDKGQFIPCLDETTLCRHYSDAGKRIKQQETGIIYDEAIDIIPCKFTYKETEIDIDTDSPVYDSLTSSYSYTEIPRINIEEMEVSN